jgi:hypothetical protein
MKRLVISGDCVFLLMLLSIVLLFVFVFICCFVYSKLLQILITTNSY